ncbi:hypothetical protein BGZ57DRAFT_962921 [Hyaloscypha finlandica]|nr:hypothetical protein BGZ57DRAFT_962921 [Hyaloscypha finlandica]
MSIEDAMNLAALSAPDQQPSYRTVIRKTSRRARRTNRGFLHQPPIDGNHQNEVLDGSMELHGDLAFDFDQVTQFGSCITVNADSQQNVQDISHLSPCLPPPSPFRQLQQLTMMNDSGSHNCFVLSMTYVAVLPLLEEATVNQRIDYLLASSLQYLHDCSEAGTCQHCVSVSFYKDVARMMRKAILKIEQRLADFGTNAIALDANVAIGGICLTGETARNIQRYLLEQIMKAATLIEQRLSIAEPNSGI